MIFLFPTELEAQDFRAACPHATVVICGVGAAQCAAATAKVIADMRDQAGGRGGDQLLILAGVAGSYSLDDIAITEVVEVASETIAALPERFSVTYQSQLRTPLRAVHSNSVNGESERDYSFQIENMEGAAFMALCQSFAVPCIEIRAISNRVGDPFAQWRLAEACKALSQRLKEMSVNLADTLGERA